MWSKFQLDELYCWNLLVTKGASAVNIYIQQKPQQNYYQQSKKENVNIRKLTISDIWKSILLVTIQSIVLLFSSGHAIKICTSNFISISIYLCVMYILYILCIYINYLNGRVDYIQVKCYIYSLNYHHFFKSQTSLTVLNITEEPMDLLCEIYLLLYTQYQKIDN